MDRVAYDDQRKTETIQDRRIYRDEVKVEALKMIKGQGLTLAEVGKRLSIPKGTIGNWVAGTGGMMEFHVMHCVMNVAVQDQREKCHQHLSFRNHLRMYLYPPDSQALFRARCRSVDQ